MVDTYTNTKKKEEVHNINTRVTRNKEAIAVTEKISFSGTGPLIKTYS